MYQCLRIEIKSLREYQLERKSCQRFRLRCFFILCKWLFRLDINLLFGTNTLSHCNDNCDFINPIISFTEKDFSWLVDFYSKLKSLAYIFLDFQKKPTYNLVYQLPSSLQVSFNRAVGTQIALVHNGHLNEKQRFLLETTVCY